MIYKGEIERDSWSKIPSYPSPISKMTQNVAIHPALTSVDIKLIAFKSVYSKSNMLHLIDPILTYHLGQY